jgi:hypothetical protein
MAKRWPKNGRRDEDGEIGDPIPSTRWQEIVKKFRLGSYLGTPLAGEVQSQAQEAPATPVEDGRFARNILSPKPHSTLRKTPDGYAQAVLSLDDKALLARCVFHLNPDRYEHLYIHNYLADFSPEEGQRLAEILQVSGNKIPIETLISPKIMPHICLDKYTRNKISTINHSFNARQKTPPDSDIARLYDDIAEGNVSKTVDERSVKLAFGAGNKIFSSSEESKAAILKSLVGNSYNVMLVVNGDDVQATLLSKYTNSGFDPAVDFDMDFAAASIPKEQVGKLTALLNSGRGKV